MENDGSPEQQADSASDIPLIQNSSTPAEEKATKSTVPQRPPPGVALCDLNQVVQELLEWVASGQPGRNNEGTDSVGDASFCLYDIEIDSNATFSDSELNFNIKDAASTNDSETDSAGDDSFCLYDFEIDSSATFSDSETDSDTDDVSTNETTAPGAVDRVDRDLDLEMVTLLVEMSRSRSASSQSAARDGASPVERRRSDQENACTNDSENQSAAEDKFCLYDFEIDSSATFSDSEMDRDIEDVSTNETTAPGADDSEDGDLDLEMPTLLVDMKRPRSASSQPAARDVAHPAKRRRLDQEDASSNYSEPYSVADDSLCRLDVEIDSSATLSDSELDSDIEEASTNDSVIETTAPGADDNEDRDLVLEMATLLVDIKRLRSANSQPAARDVAHPAKRRRLDQGSSGEQADSSSDFPVIQSSSTPAEDEATHANTEEPGSAADDSFCLYDFEIDSSAIFSDSEVDSDIEDASTNDVEADTVPGDRFCLYDVVIDSGATFSYSEMGIGIENDSTNDSLVESATPGAGDNENGSRSASRQPAARAVAHLVERRGLDQDARALSSQLEVSNLHLLVDVSVNIARKIWAVEV